MPFTMICANFVRGNTVSFSPHFSSLQLDRLFGQTWHAVVGKSFGSYVTHESKYFIYFYIGPLAFLLFRTGP